MINDKLKRRDLEHKKFSSYNLWTYIFTAKPIAVKPLPTGMISIVRISYKRSYLW